MPSSTSFINSVETLTEIMVWWLWVLVGLGYLLVGTTACAVATVQYGREESRLDYDDLMAAACCGIFWPVVLPFGGIYFGVYTLWKALVKIMAPNIEL